jgi:hypothetical protein
MFALAHMDEEVGEYLPLDVHGGPADHLVGRGQYLVHLHQDLLLDRGISVDRVIQLDRVPVPRGQHAVVVERHIKPDEHNDDGKYQGLRRNGNGVGL